METAPLADFTKPSFLPLSNEVWLSCQFWLGLPLIWQVVGIRNACWMSPLAYGLVAVGLPFVPNVNPSAPGRFSMPSLLS